jgi:hypothetical protein
MRSMCFACTTFAKEVPGLGIYSGIIIMYLKCTLPSKESKGPVIVFCALCLLYVLSTVNFFIDLLLGNLILNVSKTTLFVRISKNLSAVQNPISPLLLRVQILIFQLSISGCCDFLAQCILVRIIYHCLSSSF